MNPQIFKEIVSKGMEQPLSSMGFVPYFECSGRFFLAEFRSVRHAVSISFEPCDEFFDVRVFSIDNGTRSDPDDLEKTPTLAELNDRYRNALAEARWEPRRGYPPTEQTLQKIVHELGVVLPLYLADQPNPQFRAD